MGYNAGGEQEIAQVALELSERGHDVKVYALPFSLGGQSLVDPRTLLDDLPYEEKWLHRIDCDVAYVTYSPFCLVNFRVNAPKIAGFHSQVWFQKPTYMYGSVPLLAKLLYDLLGRPELSRFDAVHLHDSYLVRAFGFLKKPIFFIPHPVDLRRFKPLSARNEEFTVLFCGRPGWAKGFDEFVQLAEEMKNEDIQFEWLGGNAPYPNVRSLGFARDPLKVAEVMSGAHVLVMPQRVDSIGRVPLEALAVGTPVILRANPSSVPQISSLYLAQTRDEFKARILEIKRHKEEDREFTSAENDYFGDFSVEKVTDAYEEMFGSLL